MAKYAVAIYQNGIINLVEYDESIGDWTKTIGPADRNIKDDMIYARTKHFFNNPDNHIISVNFEHVLDTFTIRFISSAEGFRQLKVKL